MKIEKSPASPQVQINADGAANNENIEWTLGGANIGPVDNVNHFDMIDIFPSNGVDADPDDTLGASEFSGTLQLQSLEVPTGFTVYYATKPASELSIEPADESNSTGGDQNDGTAHVVNTATWAEWGTSGPSDLSTVTAIRFKKDGPFTAADNFTSKLVFTPKGNVAGDEYVNVTRAEATMLNSDGSFSSFRYLGPISSQVDVIGATVGDRFWEDTNGNGVQDDGEAGVPGATVKLSGTDDLGNPVALETTTDANGEYSFAGLRAAGAGGYQVMFEIPASMTPYAFTQQNVGDDRAVDSNVDAQGATTVAVMAGQNDLTVDAGIVKLAPPKAGDDEKSILPNETATLSPTITPGSGAIDTIKIIDPVTGEPTDETTVTVPGEGVWTVDPATGEFTFTPEQDYTGPVTPLEYEVTDTNGLTDRGELKVDIADPPKAGDESETINPGETATLTPVISEGSTPIDTIKIIDPATGMPTDETTVTVPGEGVWTVDPATGEFTFTPEDGFHGDATPLEYEVTDENGLTDRGQLDVLVNEGPEAGDKGGEVLPGETATLTPTITPGNSPIDTIKIIDPVTGEPTDETTVTVPGEGAWTVDPATGEFTFTPEDGFHGDATPLEYEVTDENGLTDRGQLDVLVHEGPMAGDETKSIHPDETATLKPDTKPGSTPIVSTKIIDPATGMPTDETTVTVPGEGVWTVDPATGEFTFTPEDGFHGDATPLEYEVTDENGLTDRGQLDVLVHEGPMAGDETKSIHPDETATLKPDTKPGSTPIVSTKIIDPATGMPTDETTVVVPGEGTWTVDPATGEFTFTPEKDYTGPVTPLEYEVTDERGLTDRGVLQVTIDLLDGYFTFSKSSDPASGQSVSVGDVVTYTVTVKHPGTIYAPVQGATIMDDLSKVLDDADYQGDVTASTGTATVDGSKLTWTGDLADGVEVTITYSVKVKAGGDEMIRNSVMTDDERGSCDAAVGCDTTQTMGPGMFVYSKSADVDNGAELKVGDKVTYTINVEHRGDGMVTGASIMDDLSGVLDDADYNGDVQASAGAATVVDGVLSWNGDLAYGDKVTITYSVTVKSFVGDAHLLNSVMSSDDRGSCDAEAGCETDHSVEPGTFTFSKSSNPASGSKVSVGDVVTYTLVVKHVGEGAAGVKGATITDDLSMVLDDADYQGDVTASAGTAMVENGMLTWNGDLEKGQEVTVTYSVKVKSGGDEMIRNSVMTDDERGSCDAAVGCDTTQTMGPGMFVYSKSSNVPVGSAVKPGDKVEYTLTVEHRGDGAVKGATVTDDMSKVIDDATYNGDVKASSGKAMVSDGQLTWMGDLNHGDKVTITYSVTVKTGGDRTIANVLTSADPRGACSPDAKCATTHTVPKPLATTGVNGALAGTVSGLALMLLITGGALIVLRRRNRQEA
ncbi:SdrD B-like domain-containing protein [Microbacterium sp. GXS0129]|uniref:DUF7927 domain-containing protein n=1 Tax=Microbacterium sp. GXS0129 TaxID=3377836 RepID=UPI00383AD59A